MYDESKEDSSRLNFQAFDFVRRNYDLSFYIACNKTANIIQKIYLYCKKM